MPDKQKGPPPVDPRARQAAAAGKFVVLDADGQLKGTGDTDVSAFANAFASHYAEKVAQFKAGTYPLSPHEQLVERGVIRKFFTWADVDALAIASFPGADPDQLARLRALMGRIAGLLPPREVP
jgi:hypothetical protein